MSNDQVWAVLHEADDDLSSGPFDSYEEADRFVGGFDDVYVAQADRVWLERRSVEIAAEMAAFAKEELVRAACLVWDFACRVNEADLPTQFAFQRVLSAAVAGLSSEQLERFDAHKREFVGGAR
jgi:hypothetical protein